MNNLKLQADYIKKLIKGNTKTGYVTIDNKQYITEGYAVYLLEPNFLNMDKTHEYKIDMFDKEIPLLKNVELQPTIDIYDKKELYNFINTEENINLYADKKLFKYLDKLDDYKFKSVGNLKGIYCYKYEILEAVILPVRYTKKGA